MQVPATPPTPASQSAAPASWCLRFLHGPMRGRTLSLKPGANVVGSSGECDVMLPGGDVLPQHLVFNVGELVVSVQRVGAAGVELNGEPMQAPRRSVVAGDVLRVGSVELQLDRVYVTLQERDPMFAGPESVLPPAAQEALAMPAPRPLRRVGVAVVVLSLVGIVGLSVWSGRSDARRAATPGANLQAVEQLIKPYPEVEAVALPGGALNVRGYVESRARREALRQALAPYGGAVSVNVVSADDMIEQARRFVSDPGVTIAYAGQGRLVVSGTVEDEAVRQQIRRLGEDLHPMVLVSDKVTYRPRPVRDDGGAEARAQWEAWQNVLPARMVGITEDASGLKYIQLANGNRYYEGALLRSGAELKRIDADGLVLSGGEPPKERK